MSSPTELQLDALREVANVGAGHAATALSQLMGGSKVHLDVPQAIVADPEALPSLLPLARHTRVLVATLQISGELSGHVLIALEQGDANRLAALLVNAPHGPGLEEVHRSALAEAANIVASACLSAIGTLTGFRLIPSVPTLSECRGEAALDEALREVDEGAGVVVALEARFVTSTAQRVEGEIFVVPAPRSLRRLLERLGV
jgi:chemotaxis protein CheC